MCVCVLVLNYKLRCLGILIEIYLVQGVVSYDLINDYNSDVAIKNASTSFKSSL